MTRFNFKKTAEAARGKRKSPEKESEVEITEKQAVDGLLPLAPPPTGGILGLQHAQPSHPPIKKSRVFEANDVPGATAEIFNSTKSANIEKLRRFVPGLRRPFGASFGPNGILVVPNRDGTVGLHLTPPGGASVESLHSDMVLYAASTVTSDLNLDNRIDSYIQKSKKYKDRETIWRLVKAFWAKPGPVGIALASDNLDIGQERAEELDDWLRYCLRSFKQSGLMVGDAVAEWKALSGKRTLDAYRDGTLVSQGPSVGLNEWDLLVKSYSQSDSRNALISLLTGKGFPVTSGKNWIQLFALHLWYRRRCFDSLGSILDETIQVHELSPRDGAYHLLRYASRKNDSNLAKALMSLRNNVSDWSLPWHVSQVLADKSSLLLSPRKTSVLFMNFCAQLERLGMWEWAVYVCVKAKHLEEHVKQRAVKEMLARHPRIRDDAPKIQFLQGVVNVPPEYISYSRGLFAVYCFEDESLKFFRSSRSEWIHVFATSVGPCFILRNKFDLLQKQINECPQGMGRHFWHIATAEDRFRVQTEFVGLHFLFKRMQAELHSAIVLEFRDRLRSFIGLLRERKDQVFIRSNESTVLKNFMADWASSRASALFAVDVFFREDLLQVVHLPLSSDALKLFLVRHARDLFPSHVDEES